MRVKHCSYLPENLPINENGNIKSNQLSAAFINQFYENAIKAMKLHDNLFSLK